MKTTNPTLVLLGALVALLAGIAAVLVVAGLAHSVLG
jgi:hypothetical protein